MKAAIIMENTQSRVIQISENELFILRNGVIYFDKGGYFRASKWTRKNKPDQFKKYMIDENGFFPTGIIHRVRHHLEKRGIHVDIFDNRVVPETGRFKFAMRCSEFTAYDDQVKCTQALLKAKQGIAQVPTGVGKTRIIKDNIMQIGNRSVVITPSTALKEQMAEYLEDCFGAENVGIYDKRFDAKPITVINYHSFGNTDPREWNDYHNVQFDEFHHGSNNTIFDFNLSHLNSFYFRHGLTATNFTSSEDGAILLEAVLSNTVFSMSIKDAIAKKYIVPIMPIFFDIPNAHLVSEKDRIRSPKEKVNHTKVFKQDYTTFIDKNEERNQIIRDLQSKMVSQEIPVLTLVKHVSHGRELTSPNGIFLNGQDANSKSNQEVVSRFNSGEVNEITGTSVIGEGVDTKRCGAVINAKGGKSKRELLQNIGRTVRTFRGKNIGFYFDFIDRRQSSLYAHSKERIKIIKEEFGIEPKIIKI